MTTETAVAGSVPWLAYGQMAGSAACWGLATVMTKEALTYSPPMALLAMQLTASVAFLALLLYVQRIRLNLRRPEGQAALSGVLEPGLAYAFGIAGLSMTTATNASLIGATEPLLVIALVLLIFGVKTSLRNTVAVGIAVLGVLFASLGADPTSNLNGNPRLGDGLVVIATLFAALYVVLTSRMVASIAPIPLAFLQQFIGWLVAVTIASITIGFGQENPDASRVIDGLGLIILSGIIQYAFAFLLYLQALRHLPVSMAAIFLALIPFFGVAGAAAFLGETMSVMQLCGGGLIVGAIAICRQ